MPQSAQAPVHRAQTELIVVNGGEGSGKSVTTAAEIAARYGLWELVHLVCYKYDSATNEGDYLNQYLGRIGQVRSYSAPKQGKLQLMTVTGAQVVSISTEKEGERAVTGTGKSPDIIAMIEAGKQAYEVFLACLVRISRKGGLLILSGTVEQSEPWYPELIDNCKGDNTLGATLVTIPAWENRTLYPLGRNDPKIKLLEANLPEDKFLERIAGETVPLSGRVLKEFNHTIHVKHAPYWSNDPDWKDLPVELWIDPGGDGHYAVLAVQVNGHQVWQIDEVCVEFGLASDIIGICEERPWWGNVPKFGSGKVGGVMDIAGKSHDGRESHEDIWKREARIAVGAKKVGVDDGIQRHRTFLKNPFTGTADLLHDPRCKYTLKEYGLYKRHPDSGAVIDRDNHAMKALAYGLVYHFGVAEPTQQPIRTREAVTVLDPMASMFR
jgi:hypothetical protein